MISTSERRVEHTFAHQIHNRCGCMAVTIWWWSWMPALERWNRTAGSRCRCCSHLPIFNAIWWVLITTVLEVLLIFQYAPNNIITVYKRSRLVAKHTIWGMAKGLPFQSQKMKCSEIKWLLYLIRKLSNKDIQCRSDVRFTKVSPSQSLSSHFQKKNFAKREKTVIVKLGESQPLFQFQNTGSILGGQLFQSQLLAD